MRPKRAFQTNAFDRLAADGNQPRHEQVEPIERLKQTDPAVGKPVVSLDNPKKELLGQWAREGQLYTQEAIGVFDHDGAWLAEGMALPHGLSDRRDPVGYSQLGLRHAPSEFACDSLRYWWNTDGKVCEPLAHAIWLLGDGGKRSRDDRFKQDWQALVKAWGMELRIAHDPPTPRSPIP